ncbi:2-oxo acid dehydrogenase subunit E2 [Porticoccus sp. W117]|uniref:dihydrolipoamide acetyltransferase family protein n=1 Tax=Porticoccus sp. W117 TaxID=3054777 RepID=UPI0025990527|nr:2-oxo acid dehydrogenase subunit E2 [Porticoccus sp. W117]MDM3872506.1 2-oxo acid dehydrogenase subunit E2 [Porticoccus sp. W117]
MSKKINITLPAEQLEGTEATLSQWLIAVGDSVTTDQPVAELETDKVSIEVVAPADGVVAELIANVGDQIQPDQVLASLSAGSEATVAAATATGTEDVTISSAPAVTEPDQNSGDNADQDNSHQNNNARHLIGPAVRKLVAEHNLNFDAIPGTGRGGRVTRDDVVVYLASGKAEQDKKATTAAKAPAVPSYPSSTPGSQGMPSRLVPHTQMRKSIANHMVESLLHKAPHVTSVFEMDMTNIIEHRKWHKKEYEAKGVKLTFTAYFLAACVEAMKAVPDMNAQFHDDALEIFDDINIGVGTALGEAGLVVPVVKQVQNMELFDIAGALGDQTERARGGKLTPADMKGGTFTISNHGVSGSLFAAPIIINQPQVAILGIGKLEKRVEVDENDEIRIRPKCYVSLSIDHRAVDAFQTNAWLAKFVEVIETWGQ